MVYVATNTVPATEENENNKKQIVIQHLMCDVWCLKFCKKCNCNMFSIT